MAILCSEWLNLQFDASPVLAQFARQGVYIKIGEPD